MTNFTIKGLRTSGILNEEVGDLSEYVDNPKLDSKGTFCSSPICSQLTNYKKGLLVRIDTYFHSKCPRCGSTGFIFHEPQITDKERITYHERIANQRKKKISS